jgi:lipoprotein-anchoring transpeptidase ErfK/SrfK
MPLIWRIMGYYGMRRLRLGGGVLGRIIGCTSVVGLAMFLAACAAPRQTASYNVSPAMVAMYAPVETEPHRVPAVAVRKVDPRYLRQEVATPANIRAEPGTIVVDPTNRFLYLVETGGQSMRYGIGVGKQGFSWTGTAVIKDKQEWPKWFPPKEMQERDLRARRYADGMEGGPTNPLGARALYLYVGDKDTLYRLHGTSEQASIGRAVSSGCIRLFNQDVIDLYNRVPLGTKVIVLGPPQGIPAGDDTAPVQVGSAGSAKPAAGSI